MASAWYYTRGGKKEGPISSQQLRQLAEAGQLQPTDRVWKEGVAKPVEARFVKGLFPQMHHGHAPQENDPQHAASQPTTRSDAQQGSPAGPPPLTSTPNGLPADEKWYSQRGGLQFGPFSFRQLNQLAASGQLLPSDFVAREGGKWIMAGHLLMIYTRPLTSGPSSVDQWYFQRSGQQFGPVAFAQLQQLASSGQLYPTDFIGREGMNWVQAGYLLTHIGVQATGMPHQQPHTFSSQWPTNAQPRVAWDKRRKAVAWGLGAFIVLGVIATTKDKGKDETPGSTEKRQQQAVESGGKYTYGDVAKRIKDRDEKGLVEVRKSYGGATLEVYGREVTKMREKLKQEVDPLLAAVNLPPISVHFNCNDAFTDVEIGTPTYDARGAVVEFPLKYTAKKRVFRNEFSQVESYMVQAYDNRGLPLMEWHWGNMRQGAHVSPGEKVSAHFIVSPGRLGEIASFKIAERQSRGGTGIAGRPSTDPGVEAQVQDVVNQLKRSGNYSPEAEKNARDFLEAYKRAGEKK
jgi:hypothetical protein